MKKYNSFFSYLEIFHFKVISTILDGSLDSQRLLFRKALQMTILSRLFKIIHGFNISNIYGFYISNIYIYIYIKQNNMINIKQKENPQKWNAEQNTQDKNN